MFSPILFYCVTIWRTTNIDSAWKPLQLPVRDWPLAICDATTIDRDTDLIQTDIIYPKYLAENYMGHHNPKQKWYWLQDHQPDEILVFKAFDSDGPGSWREFDLFS